MTETTDLAGLTTLLLMPQEKNRIILAIAGPPGSGKSTLARGLVDALNRATPGHAALLEMDGFHFDDRVLTGMGRQAHKGAPDTFDVGGLAHVLARLRNNFEETVAVPVFDRDIEIARAGARLIARTCGVVVVEGNYLLLNQPPWNALAAEFDITVMIETPMAILRDRLMTRWNELGLSPRDALRKVEENDLPNGRFVEENSIGPDYKVTS